MKKTNTLNVRKKLSSNHNQTALALNVRKKLSSNHNESALRVTK
jgi:hypothetical protein